MNRLDHSVTDFRSWIDLLNGSNPLAARQPEISETSLLEGMNIGIIRVSADAEGRLLHANAAAVRLLGLQPAEQHRPHTISNFLDTSFDWKTRLKSIQGMEGKNRWCTRLKRLDGSVFQAVLTAVYRAAPPAHCDIGIQDRSELAAAEKKISLLKEQLLKEQTLLTQEARVKENHNDIVGDSRGMNEVLFQVEQVAGEDTAVIVSGETGTGKELVARAIHRLSPRRNHQLITVNCAALPATLIESELFGREKGAYTGALTSQIGRFQAADQSTLFLDEIGELPLELQAKLLRVLEEGAFEKLGSTKTLKVNVRIVTATNRDLLREVKAGRFRQDLYYRLSVFPIKVPPLRHRKDDIPPLVWHFIKRYSRRMGKQVEQIRQNDLDALMQYDWPGNIRELKNVIEKSLIQTTGPVINICLEPDPTQSSVYFKTLDDIQREHIQKALSRTRNVVSGKSGAARLLGINPKTLWSRMAKLGISAK